jgi:hypothetical protein
MELRCSICKDKITIESEVVAVFECYLYCDKCMMQMERNEPIHTGDHAREEPPVEKLF